MHTIKKIMQKYTKLYYTLTSLVILAQVGYTLVYGSLVLYQGRHVAQLAAEREQLLERRTQLHRELTEHQSLTQLRATEAFASYVPITESVTLTHTDSLASR